MPFNPKSLKNLELFKPGHKKSKGRPKGSVNFKKALKEELGKEIDEEYISQLPEELREKFRNKSKIYVGVFRLINNFLMGDIKSAKLIIETLEGKPAVSNNISVSSVTHEDLIKDFRSKISEKEFEEILYDDSEEIVCPEVDKKDE